MARANRKSGRRRIVPKKKPGLDVAASTPALAAQKKNVNLLFISSALPANIGQRLQQYLPGLGEPVWEIDEDLEAPKEGVLHATIKIGPHEMKLVGFSAPVPKEVAKMSFDCSHWNEQDKIKLRGHTHHMICYYLGGSEDAGEQLLVTSKLAACLVEDGLLGIVDTDAWNCTPAHVLQSMMEPEMRETCLESLPLPIWTGFAKIFVTSDEVWFCSKGFHRWGIMDFAWHGTMEDANEAYDLFHGLFNYARDSQAKLKVGDTAQFGDNLILRFGKVTEYHDYLLGPLGTLVIERLDPAQFH